MDGAYIQGSIESYMTDMGPWIPYGIGDRDENNEALYMYLSRRRGAPQSQEDEAFRE